MTTKISSLRVTAEMDVASYVRGAAQKEAADKKLVASSQEVGQALAAQDAQAAKLGIGVASLSRSYIAGYAPAAKFEAAVRQVGNALERGMDPGRAAAALTGIYTKFSQTADAAVLAKQNFVSLAPIVSSLNTQFDAMATAQERAATAAKNLASAQQSQASINSRLGAAGIGRQAPAYTPDRLAVLEKESARQFKDEVDSAIRVRSEAATRAEANRREIENRLGMAGVGRQTSGYTPDRLAVLDAEAARQEQAVIRAEIARREAIGGALGRNIDSRIGYASADPRGRDAGASAAVFEAQFARQDAEEKKRLEQSAAGLRQSLLPMQSELERNKANLTEIDKLEKARVISINEAVQMRAAEALRTDQSRKSIEGMFIAQGKYASGVGLARNEVVNLSRQLQDVVVTLQAGQPLSTILLQQGTQIADIFATSRASLSGFFSQAARGIAGFATSIPGVLTGLAAIGAGAIYVGTKFGDSQREVERSLSGIGRVSGATVGEVNRVAEALTNQQRISVSAARDLAASGAAGGVRSANLGQFSSLARDYAAQTGQGLEEAGSEMAKALANPTKGADVLNEKLGFLDARTKEYIRTLQNQGNTTGAQKALLDAMTSSVQGAAERVSILTKAWEAIKVAASNAIDAMGAGVAAQITLQDRLKAKLVERAAIERDVIRRLTGNTSGLDKVDEEIARLNRVIEAEKDLARIQADRVRANQLSLKNDTLVKGATEDLERIKELKAAVDSLGRGAGGQNADGFARAADAYANALKSALTNQERIRVESDLAVKSTLARTQAEQQAVAVERERLSMAGQIIDAAERELRLRKSMLEVQAQAIRESRDNLRSANDNAATAGLLPYQAERLRIEQRYRDLNQRTGGVGTAPTAAPADGYVGYGPFRIPAAGAAAASSAAATGLNPEFAARVKALIDAVGDSGATMTSGFRSREKQQELYDRYGPGRAAAPGNSQHERGTAADYTFSSAEARTRAIALANQPGSGIRALPSNGGAVHFDTGKVDASTAALGNNTTAMNANARAAELAALERTTIDLALKKSAMDLANQNQLLNLQEQNFQKSTYQVARAAKEQELLNSFFQQGVPLTDGLRKSVSDLADAYGRTAERGASLRLTQEATFERQQLFRSDSERSIASRVIPAGLSMDGPEAAMLRYNQAIETTSGSLGTLFNDIRKGAENGEKPIETIRKSLLRIADPLVTGMLNNLARQIAQLAFGQGSGSSGFGGLLGMLFGGGGATAGSGVLPVSGLPIGYAKGGAFSASNVIPFAKGGAFTNSVVSRPTIFPFAKGVGLMGEAGPEAIMPLRRGAGGRLGVEMTGGGSGATIVQQGDIIINNNTGSQVQATRGDDGRTMIDIVDAAGARMAGQALRGRGAFADVIPSSNRAARRPG
jgi:hypothetical protein